MLIGARCLQVAVALCVTLALPALRAHTNQTPRVTPGSIALLGNNLDGEAVDRVLRAVADDDPAVRTVAARIAAVTSHAAFVAALRAAWDRESNDAAATEQARALLHIQGTKVGGVIEEKLDTVPQRVAGMYAEWLAESSPERFAGLLPRLLASLEDWDSLQAESNRVLKSRPDLAEAVLRAYRPVLTKISWKGLLEEISLEKPSPELLAILIDGIDASESDVREDTVWAMIHRLSDGRNVPQALLDAVAASAHTVETQSSPTWEQFGREILIRQLQRKAAIDRAGYLTEQISAHPMDAQALASTSYLTKDEDRSLRKGLGNQYPRPASKNSSAGTGPSSVAMRTIPTLWPGFLKSLFDASGCRQTPERNPPGVVFAKYRSNRTLQGMSTTPTKISAECTAALTAVARLTLADPAYPPPDGTGEYLILPLDREFFGCIAEQRDTAGVATRIRGVPTPPKKTRDVKPIYPSDALQQKVQGVVMIEATISATGCITNARVIRGVHQSMDFSALQAVWGWRFTPTTLNGAPVPTVMTVTVNFTLG